MGRLALLLRRKAISRQQRALDRGLRRRGGVQPADARAVDDGGHVLGVQVARPLDGRRRRPAHALQIKPVGLAQPHHQHAPRADGPARVEHGHFARLALQVTAGDEVADGPAQRPIQRARRPTGGGDAFE